MSKVNSQEASEIARKLLTWYHGHKRDLPWRRTSDPYKIWVSEVMLQQTRVETVIPYWTRFIERFPTIESLASAPAEEVLKLWEGLGYYSRARNLQTAVREVHEKYGGRVPDSLEKISSLSGVGPYTAGAVLSIAYNVTVPAVDGNVFRVLSRLFLIEEDVAKPATRKKFESLAEFLIPPGEASDFNQSLMEFGATICIPKHPRCPSCPLHTLCRAHREGMQEDLPYKAKKKPPRPLDILTGIVHDGDRVLISRRPMEGLLAGMWEFPSFEAEPGEVHVDALAKFLFQRYGILSAVEHHFANVQHTFSHLHWNLQAYSCRLASVIESESVETTLASVQYSGSEPAAGKTVSVESIDTRSVLTETGNENDSAEGEPGNLRWVPVWQLNDFAMPAAYQKLAKLLQGLV